MPLYRTRFYDCFYRTGFVLRPRIRGIRPTFELSKNSALILRRNAWSRNAKKTGNDKWLLFSVKRRSVKTLGNMSTGEKKSVPETNAYCGHDYIITRKQHHAGTASPNGWGRIAIRERMKRRIIIYGARLYDIIVITGLVILLLLWEGSFAKAHSNECRFTYLMRVIIVIYSMFIMKSCCWEGAKFA